MTTPGNPNLTLTVTAVTPEHIHDKVDTHSFAHQLDYPDDDQDNDGLLFMASPTQAELDAPYDPDKHLLTPGQGSPKMDPAYTNHLQNPDSYGPNLTLI
jgi:hypothetical protein